MGNIFPTVIKKFYSKWNIQGFILLSLCLQTILVLFAPFRKRSRNPILIGLIWLAYLLADWAANIAVGLISRHNACYRKPDDDRVDILAFWASFLLLHLGGPDTISAFSLEDNALWLRHLVGLITQVLAAIIVFNQSLPTNKLWISTVFLFVAGTIKYGERTCALYLANLNTFQESVLKDPDPGPNYAKLMEEYASMNEEDDIIPEPNEDWEAVSPKQVENELDDTAMVKHGYRFFKIFKGLIADAIFSVSERQDSRLFFLKRTSNDAFGVLAIELNFFYEVFYTKDVVVYSKFGFIIRFMSWCAILIAFSTFYSMDKRDYPKVNVQITYTLLFGAIGLEAIALFRLAISDWTVAYIEKFSEDGGWIAHLCKCFLYLPQYFLALRGIKWLTVAESTSSFGDSVLGCIDWIRRFPFRIFDWSRRMLFWRWSGSLHTLNLIDYCLKERPRVNRTILDRFTKLISFISCFNNICERIKHVFKKPVEEKLWGSIFNELKTKSELTNGPNVGKRARSARVDWILQDKNLKNLNSMLMSYVNDVDYDQSLLMWHIATDLCYERDKVDSSDSHSREISKIMSDYMLYLLVMQPAFMSTVVGIGKIRYRDTCAEAKDFFRRKLPERKSQEEEREKACQEILAVNTDIKPITLKGDKSKSVLFDACILAKELQTLNSHVRWELIKKVWVELLSYAAAYCRADMHVAQLSKGGELITFLWLLMAHFGLGDNFQSYTGTAASVATNILQPPTY